MKGKIDKAFLHVGKQLANLMFGTYSLSDGLSHMTDLLGLSYDTIFDRMSICEFPAFIVLNTFETAEQELNGILKDFFRHLIFLKNGHIVSLNCWTGYEFIAILYRKEIHIFHLAPTHLAHLMIWQLLLGQV